MPGAHLYNDILIPKETTADFMWLMGLLTGDGHVDIQQNKINIATHYKEDYRDLLCATLKKLFNYTVTEKKDRYIIINSKTLCRLFSKIGFCGSADTKKIPPWVFELPEEQIQAFLAGYFDSDGHVASYALVFTSINKELLDQVKLLGINLGYGVSQIIKHRAAGTAMILGKKCNTRDSWRLLFNGSKIFQLPARCQKKRNKINILKTRRNFTTANGLNFRSKTNEEIGFSKIISIEKLGVQPTYDIEVEKNHNFIANGLIVHNSGVTMLYPSSILRGRGARSDSLGIAFAGPGQNQDTGAKAIHAAPYTSSTIRSRSISVGGGVATFRGLMKVLKKAKGSMCSMSCQSLLLDEASVANTYPALKIDTSDVSATHEATIGKVGEDQLFYLMSRGLSEEQAMRLIVSGFVEPVIKALPLEYALELNRLLELEMEVAVG